jgi:hypothetical protein
MEPGMSRRLRSWKEDVDAIRKVLMSEWDPIGFGHLLPADEYDSYIPMIYSAIQSRARVEDLAKHLEQIETERIGLPARPEVNRQVARSLLGLIDD